MSGWNDAKNQALRRLFAHLYSGKVDADISLEIVELNLLKDCIYTTSSCSGRVALITARDMFDKKGAELLWLTHSPGECEAAICRVTPRRPTPEPSWLSLQPPIIHLRARDRAVADAVVRCARDAGFSRACYRFENGAYTVEIAAHDKVHLILPAPCRAALMLCRQLRVYKARLKRLLGCIRGLACY